MDKVLVEGMRLFGRIGVLERERVDGQDFLVDVAVGVCLEKAGRSDVLSDTVNYAEIVEMAKDLMDVAKFQLVEKYAQTLAEKVLERFESARSVRIAVRKPNAPIGGSVKAVGVEIERFRDG